MGELNLFAYCNNNPVNLIDTDGREAVTIVVALMTVLLGSELLALSIIPAFNSEQFNSVVLNVAETISGGITFVRSVRCTATAYAISGTIKIAKSLNDSFESITTKPNYRSPRELHHLVAKGANNARYARQILERVGIGVNSGYNLLSIKTGLHRRLHTNSYYGWANSVLISAYQAAGNDARRQREYVIKALGSIRAFVMSLDAIAPF